MSYETDSDIIESTRHMQNSYQTKNKILDRAQNRYTNHELYMLRLLNITVDNFAGVIPMFQTARLLASTGRNLSGVNNGEQEM